MEIFLSPTAGRAAFTDGDDTYYIDLDRPNDHVWFADNHVPVAALARLFGDGTDITRISVPTLEDGLRIALTACNQDSALRLFQMVVEFGDDLPLAIDAAAALEPILAEEKTFSFLRNYAFAIPCEPLADISLPPEAMNTNPLCFDFLKKVIFAQPQIRTIRETWTSISARHFSTRLSLLQAEKAFVDSGGFWQVHETMLGNKRRDDLTIALLIAGERVAGCRDLLKSWFDALNLEREWKKPYLTLDFETVVESDRASYSLAPSSNGPFETDKEKFQRVMTEQTAIIERMERRDIRNARRFTERLVSRQIEDGDAEFAAKTLCALAQEAKRLGESSIYLEWSIRATEVYEEDPWSYAQVGDALVSLYRYSEASNYFAIAGTKGDVHYARMGRARVMMLTGQQNEALKEFEDIIQKFPEHENTYQAWIGAADTLRHNGQLDLALQRYEQCISKYADLAEAYSNKALVFRELGRLDDAIAIYLEFQENRGGPIWAFLGEGDVWRDAGDFEKALQVYELAATHYPDAEALALGRAQVLRAAGRLDEALREFENAAVRHENSPSVFGGLAQTLRDLGHLNDALEVYNKAIKRFPSIAFLMNGRASVINKLGQPEEALAAYDENCRKFPYNLPALLGRVQLLKEFERLDLAFDAAEALVDRYPENLRAKTAMAGILALRGEFKNALHLLPDQRPRTRDEWVAHHIGCMIELKDGNLDRALTRLEFGLEHVPFYRNKRYYQNALAAAQLKRRHFAEALDAASNGEGAASDILIVQAASAIGQRGTAVTSLDRLMKDPRNNVVYFAEEIARRLHYTSSQPEQSAHWIAERNTDIVLALAA